MKIAAKAEQNIECLASFVHGLLAGLHALGIVYNIKRRNWLGAAAHSAGMSYDIWATVEHIDAWERLSARPSGLPARQSHDCSPSPYIDIETDQLLQEVLLSR